MFPVGNENNSAEIDTVEVRLAFTVAQVAFMFNLSGYNSV